MQNNDKYVVSRKIWLEGGRTGKDEEERIRGIKLSSIFGHIERPETLQDIVNSRINAEH